MRMREPCTGLAGMPAFRDEADFGLRGGTRARVVVARGAGPSHLCTWAPASVWFVAHGRALLASGELAVELEPGIAFVAEHGARISVMADFGASAVCALLLPEPVVARCGLVELGRVVRGPLVLPELVREAPTLLGPLLRHARVALAPELDHGAPPVPLESLVRALVQRQSTWDGALARCPGRTERHRRHLFVRLARTRLALAHGGGVGFPLARLARIANLSPTHYLRVYRRVFGHTPHEHATHMRLSEAHRRLVATDQPVAEIGYALGFSNRCAFTRAFRAYHGAAPSVLRMRARAQRGAGGPGTAARRDVPLSVPVAP